MASGVAIRGMLMPYRGGSVEISSPTDGSVMAQGSETLVRGTTEPVEFFKDVGDIENEIPPDSVTVQIDGGAGQSVVQTGAGWSTWQLPIRLPAAGQHRVTATARWASPSPPGGKTVTSSIDLTVQATAVNVVLPNAPVGTVDFTVAVQAEHPAGISQVRARVDGQVWQPLSSANGVWSGSLRLPSDMVPVGGRNTTVEAMAVSGDGVSHAGAATIRLVDSGVPVVTGFTPTEGAKLVGSKVGASVDVVAVVRDSGPGQLRSGVADVVVDVDGAGAVKAQQVTSGEPSVWSARVFIPGADQHLIQVRALGEGGAQSSTTVTHRVVVVSPVDLPDLTQQTYLRDLISFTTSRVLTGTAPGGSAVVSVGHLAQALGQDLPRVLEAASDDVTAPVHTLRLVAENLSRSLRPRPAPVAAWLLDEGEGAVARDSASGLCDGTIEGGSWQHEPTGSVLRFDPAKPSRVRVPAQGAEQVRVANKLTVSAWVRPAAAASNNGVIVNKEGEYEVARFTDGTIRWALSVPDPGWTWIDTGAVAPAGEWSHVALSYDGTRTRTWLNGELRHELHTTGPIGDSSPGADELWIGGRPTMTEYFAGDIAAVAVFDRALSTYEVRRLANRGDVAETATWVDDALPADGQPLVDSDAWEWVSVDPAPATGALCHRSTIASGIHQHYFTTTTTAWSVDGGDLLTTDVWLDPANAPASVMLQFRDENGSWEHRAYWGADTFTWGTPDSASRRRMGDLPSLGEWVTLTVPARAVGLDRATVHGVAYVLFDGRAAWDNTRRIPVAAQPTFQTHLATAYSTLLRQHGTSEVELRLSRSASEDQRLALANRLGITLSTPPAGQPDELSLLLLDPDELTPQALHDLFGFSDPQDGGWGSGQDPALITAWRLSALRRRWRVEDHGETPSGAPPRPPMVDPEIVTASDLRDATSPAARALATRNEWRQSQLTALRGLRGTNNDKEAVAAAIKNVLDGVDLDALNAERRAGHDVSAALAANSLSLPGLYRILQIRALADAGPIRTAEWEDLLTELVHVLRLRNWQTWRQEEKTRDIVIDPDIFQIGEAPVPVYFDRPGRQSWTDRLLARQTAVESALGAQASALAAADAASMPKLRDALVAALDPGIGFSETTNVLTSILFIDVGAGGQDVTSRLGQAAESVQSLVGALRANRLTPPVVWPTLPQASWQLRKSADYPRAKFDEEWRWMGAFGAWQAAVSVFFRPELLLLPTLRPDPSGAFVELVKALSADGADLTPQRARTLATAFKAKLTPDQAHDIVTIDKLVLTDQLEPAGIADLATDQATLLKQYTALRDVPRHLLEALWLVPLQLAVALSRAGQHQAALDWLGTLYSTLR